MIDRPSSLALGMALLGGLIFFWERNHLRPPARLGPLALTSSVTAPSRPPLANHASAARIRPASKVNADSSEVAPTDLLSTIQLALHDLSLLDTADEMTRAELLHQLNAIVTPENAADIARHLTNEELRTDFGTTVMISWLESDGAAAVSWLRSHDIREEQAEAIGAALAAQAPEQLQVANAALTGSSMRTALLHAAALALSDTEPARAAALADELPAGEARDDALQTIAYAWAARNPIATAQFILSITDSGTREALCATAAKAIANSDPAGAALWLAESVHHDALVDSAVESIVNRWAVQDAASAAAWVSSLATTDTRVRAVETVLNAWRDKDTNAADAWLQSLPDRETVFADLAAQQAERDAPKSD